MPADSLVRCSTITAAVVLAAQAALAVASDPFLAVYAENIRPLLAERCFSCHGGLKQEAGLRLDTVGLMVEGGESGSVVTKADPDKSLILERVSDPEPASRMPPEGEGEPLTAEQLAMLRDWIIAGCPAPPDEKPEADPRDHWAFQPRLRPAVPAVKHTARVKNPIDAFLAHKHEEAGIAPQPEAPRHVLVRRLFIDLIGLPPQPEELAALQTDTSADWYEQLVEKLLADPRHGERWGRHWMDIWRYADWWGLGNQHRYSQKHIWHFRDWIVESLNADTGYDEMVRLMLAADELHPDDPAKLRATGFLARNWFLFNRTPWLDETVEHVGKGLLGLTMNCSKCHAHKYDPVSQEDYYRFRAFFEPIETRVDVVAGEGDLEKDGLPRVFDGHLDRPTYLFVRGEDTKPDTSRAILPGVPAVFSFREIEIQPVRLPKAAFEPERQPWVLDAHVATARRAVADAEAKQAKEPSVANEQAVAAARADLAAVEARALGRGRGCQTRDRGDGQEERRRPRRDREGTRDGPRVGSQGCEGGGRVGRNIHAAGRGAMDRHAIQELRQRRPRGAVRHHEQRPADGPGPLDHRPAESAHGPGGGQPHLDAAHGHAAGDHRLRVRP